MKVPVLPGKEPTPFLHDNGTDYFIRTVQRELRQEEWIDELGTIQNHLSNQNIRSAWYRHDAAGKHQQHTRLEEITKHHPLLGLNKTCTYELDPSTPAILYREDDEKDIRFAADINLELAVLNNDLETYNIKKTLYWSFPQRVHATK